MRAGLVEFRFATGHSLYLKDWLQLNLIKGLIQAFELFEANKLTFIYMFTKLLR